MYHAELMEHFRHSPYRGTLSDPTFVIEDYNPSCGDRISLYVAIREGVIATLRFTGSGCVLSQAGASMLAEEVTGETVEHVLQLSGQDMQKWVGISVGPNRLKCILLSLQALQHGIKKHQ